MKEEKYIETVEPKRKMILPTYVVIQHINDIKSRNERQTSQGAVAKKKRQSKKDTKTCIESYQIQEQVKSVIS